MGGGLVFGLVFGLIEWLNNPSFPAPWSSDEKRIEQKCAEEASNQPYVSKDYYAEYFEDCLMRSGEKNPVVVPSDKSIEEVS